MNVLSIHVRHGLTRPRNSDSPPRNISHLSTPPRLPSPLPLTVRYRAARHRTRSRHSSARAITTRHALRPPRPRTKRTHISPLPRMNWTHISPSPYGPDAHLPLPSPAVPLATLRTKSPLPPSPSLTFPYSIPLQYTARRPGCGLRRAVQGCKSAERPGRARRRRSWRARGRSSCATAAR